ncbi:MAG: hypothetical protein HYZ54_00815 [Ignavibacteriae bacterium]|nr:hypothetical protein [Ignavibacteriota bacterium]
MSDPAIQPELSVLFVPSRKLLRRVLMSLFSIAGLSWFLLLLPSSTINQAKHDIFKANQYQLYLLLLTLWGYDFRRQSKRLEWLIEFSKDRKSISEITKEDVTLAGKLSLFEVFTKYKGSSAQYFHIIFTWFLLIASVGQFIRQLILLFGSQV